MSKKSVLMCSKLAKTYRQGPEVIDVLRNLNMDVKRGETIAIVGASGSGKTTLLNLLGGLDDPCEGEVKIVGQLYAGMSESARATLRNQHLGFVYQFHHLLAEFSAMENVAMPLLIGGMSVSEARQTAMQLLVKVGLGERAKHKPAELSGGERQRVAIARALVTNPSCVLMDEPTGNLDPETADTILSLLKELNEQLAISFVVVTHDPHVAGQMDRILRLEHGQLTCTAVSGKSAAGED
jgi:lipoprotein-releasing system ATP-binding protein